MRCSYRRSVLDVVLCGVSRALSEKTLDFFIADVIPTVNRRYLDAALLPPPPTCHSRNPDLPEPGMEELSFERHLNPCLSVSTFKFARSAAGAGAGFRRFGGIQPGRHSFGLTCPASKFSAHVWVIISSAVRALKMHISCMAAHCCSERRLKTIHTGGVSWSNPFLRLE